MERQPFVNGFLGLVMLVGGIALIAYAWTTLTPALHHGGANGPLSSSRSQHIMAGSILMGGSVYFWYLALSGR